MNFELHPSARQELADAVEYYRQISPRLGNSFVDEFESAVNRIISFPEAWPKLSKNTRRCRINHFPYGIIYAVERQNILIIAIMHLQREPNYWVDRL